MNTKTVITAVLLVFVGSSIAYMAIKEMRAENKASKRIESPITIAPKSNLENVPKTDADETIIAYYFHGDMRCPTCLKLEKYAEEALKTHFADKLESGRIKWKVINVDLPENQHFIEDYQLISKSVILVAMKDGKQTRWTNLESIWDLVSDKEAYIEYIRNDTQEFLEGTS